MMAILRCKHCGLVGDGVHGQPHKSTCKSTGKDDTYVTVGNAPKVATPTPEPIVATTSTSPTKKKNKGRK